MRASQNVIPFCFKSANSGEYLGCSKAVDPNVCVLLNIIMQRRALSIGKLGLSSDYHLFDSMKECLRGKHYAREEEIKTAVMKWLKKKNS